MRQHLPLQRDHVIIPATRPRGDTTAVEAGAVDAGTVEASAVEASAWRESYSLRQRTHEDWLATHSLPLSDLVGGNAGPAATFLDEVEQILAAYQSRRHLRAVDEALLSLPRISSEGFDIDVLVTTDRMTASFGGLDHDFRDLATTMCWVRRALSPDYTLQITSIGVRPVEWLLTRRAAPGEAGTTLRAGLGLWLRRWRALTTQDRGNDVLVLRRETISEITPGRVLKTSARSPGRRAPSDHAR